MRTSFLAVSLSSILVGVAVGCSGAVDEEVVDTDTAELTSDGGIVRVDASNPFDAGGCVPPTPDASTWSDGGEVVDAGPAAHFLTGEWGSSEGHLSVVKKVATLTLPCAEGTFVAPELYEFYNGVDGGGALTKTFTGEGAFRPNLMSASEIRVIYYGYIQNGVMLLSVFRRVDDAGASQVFVKATLKRNDTTAFSRCK